MLVFVWKLEGKVRHYFCWPAFLPPGRRGGPREGPCTRRQNEQSAADDDDEEDTKRRIIIHRHPNEATTMVINQQQKQQQKQQQTATTNRHKTTVPFLHANVVARRPSSGPSPDGGLTRFGYVLYDEVPEQYPKREGAPEPVVPAHGRDDCILVRCWRGISSRTTTTTIPVDSLRAILKNKACPR
jgi:hypothetical protein